MEERDLARFEGLSQWGKTLLTQYRTTPRKPLTVATTWKFRTHHIQLISLDLAVCDRNPDFCWGTSTKYKPRAISSINFAHLSRPFFSNWCTSIFSNWCTSIFQIARHAIYVYIKVSIYQYQRNFFYDFWLEMSFICITQQIHYVTNP